MRFGAAFWVQRTGWPELHDAVLRAEAVGFDDVWIDDHLLCDEGDWSDPKLEGWTALAALAAITSRVRLGHMVVANTFRSPGLVAKMAATVDHVSDGRVILGLGAGWFEREHDAFGLKFGPWVGERIDRLAEAASVIRQLLDGERVTHDGPHYRLHDAICSPRPVQARLPILIGGAGPKKTIPLVARLADQWNAFGPPEKVAAADAVLRDACEAIGRDEAEIERTVALNVVIRGSRGEADAVWADYAARHLPIDTEKELNAGGSLEETADRLRAYAQLGFRHPVLIFRTPWDLETIDRLPELRAALAA
jgi:F420-dependent oxidoreductase-like protein